MFYTYVKLYTHIIHLHNILMYSNLYYMSVCLLQTHPATKSVRATWTLDNDVCNCRILMNFKLTYIMKSSGKNIKLKNKMNKYSSKIPKNDQINVYSVAVEMRKNEQWLNGFASVKRTLIYQIMQWKYGKQLRNGIQNQK